MLYVLVNNDYHLHALRRHGIASLSGQQGAALITVPHALSPILDTGEFQAVHRFDTPLGRVRMPLTLWRYGMQARAIARTLNPGPKDTLLFFSEMEWLNQIIVQYFRKRGARIVLLDDGGLGPYISMSLPESEPLNLRERSTQAAFRLVPELRQSSLFKVNRVLWPRLPDDAIDVIAQYHDVPLHRHVRRCQVRPSRRKDCELRPSSVMFLNQDMYAYYQTGQSYLAGLRRLMTALTKGFETVHFKFHPSEPKDWKARIRELLTLEFPAVEIIDRAGIVEEMVQIYRPGVLASYFSTALSNIEYKGVEPLYLYHLLDDLKEQPVSMAISSILRMWGYHFVGSDDEIRSGYRSGVADASAGVELRHLLSPSDAQFSAPPARVMQKELHRDPAKS